MVWPRVVPHPVVYGMVGVTCAFGAEFPYSPILAVLRVEEFDEAVEGVSVGALRICA